jgi:hypothetical protein
MGDGIESVFVHLQSCVCCNDFRRDGGNSPAKAGIGWPVAGEMGREQNEIQRLTTVATFVATRTGFVRFSGVVLR